MERNDFLKLCQKCATIPDRICGIKSNLPVDLLVRHVDNAYYPVGLKITFDKDGNSKDTAILHSLHTNSICEESLERVSRNE